MTTYQSRERADAEAAYAILATHILDRETGLCLVCRTAGPCRPANAAANRLADLGFPLTATEPEPVPDGPVTRFRRGIVQRFDRWTNQRGEQWWNQRHHHKDNRPDDRRAERRADRTNARGGRHRRQRIGLVPALGNQR
jgi:hypothetical protein